MAHKKGVGSTTNGRESNPKFLGVKRFDREKVLAGHVLMRQRGTQVQPGLNVGVGRDHTLFALIDGYVLFEHATRLRKRISVYAEMPPYKQALPGHTDGKEAKVAKAAAKSKQVMANKQIIAKQQAAAKQVAAK